MWTSEEKLLRLAGGVATGQPFVKGVRMLVDAVERLVAEAGVVLQGVAV